MHTSPDALHQRVASILRGHPVTGGPLEVVNILVEFPRVSEMGGAAIASLEEALRLYGTVEKAPAKARVGKFSPYEGHGWKLLFRAVSTEEEIGGLVILLASYHGVEYVFEAMVPWLGTGPFWQVAPPYVLNVLQAGPAVLEIAGGFLIYARYKLGYQTSLEEFFYFDETGNFIPFVYYQGLRPMGYIPIYVDFDIGGPFDNSAAAYSPEAVQRWNQVVSEFESTEARFGLPAPDDRHHRLMNVLLFKQGAMWPWVETYVNPDDNPGQYVACYATYGLMKHPRMSLAGRSVVRKDSVYVYVVRSASPGLHGPRFIARRIPESVWAAREAAGMDEHDGAGLLGYPCIAMAGQGRDEGEP